MELGQKLREVRRSKGVTLNTVASESGLSKSFVSQVESGVTNPSIASIKKICDVLSIPLAELFDDNATINPASANGVAPPQAGPEAGQTYHNDVRVVRADRRKMLVFPGDEAKIYLLSPDLQRKLEVTLSQLEPGYSTGSEAYSHHGEELGFVLEGRLEVTVNDQVFALEEGDSIYYSSLLPHKMRVVGDMVCKTVWVITPPSF